jgi:hypothetical protein
MLSDKYLWLVPELTPVYEVYKLASFQELVTNNLFPVPNGNSDGLHKLALQRLLQKKMYM